MSAAVEAMTWRPIETAPKDESEILLYCPGDDRKYVVAFWSSDGDWFEHEWSSNPLYDPPTHWMPLPNPPAE